MAPEARNGCLDGCLRRDAMRAYAASCLQDYLFSYQEFGDPKVAALVAGDQAGGTLDAFVRVQVRRLHTPPPPARFASARN
jgi:hypothetical protein